MRSFSCGATRTHDHGSCTMRTARRDAITDIPVPPQLYCVWQGQEHRECASTFRGTLNLDISSMCLGNRVGNTEPETGPPCLLHLGIGDTVKTLKNVRLLFWGEADAGIRDTQRRPGVLPLHGESNPAAVRRVLETVVKQIQQE